MIDAAAVSDLNGDEAFGVDYDSNAIYGFVSFDNVIPKFIYGMGVQYITRSSGRMLEASCNTEKFITTCRKLAEFFGTEGSELKTASLLRNME